MTIEISQCGDRPISDLVKFIAGLNPAPEDHIGYFGVEPADIMHTLENLYPPVSLGFHLALESGSLIGLMGAEADPEIGRAWLFGPLIQHSEWQPVARRLYAAIQPAIPGGIRQHELFFDIHNLRCLDFALEHGFSLYSQIANLEISRLQASVLPPGSARGYLPGDFEQLDRLHTTIFPNTYYTTRQMVDLQSQQVQLLVAASGGELGGYIFFKFDPQVGEGYIDFLGVAEAKRRQGIARRLLCAALQVIFSAPDVEHVNLIVVSSNQAALALYQSLGFEHKQDMLGYRKTVLPG